MTRSIKRCNEFSSDISALKTATSASPHLAGHIEKGAFITKFRKLFARDEMNDDLAIVPAREGQKEDDFEYEQILPTSPP